MPLAAWDDIIIVLSIVGTKSGIYCRMDFFG